MCPAAFADTSGSPPLQIMVPLSCLPQSHLRDYMVLFAAGFDVVEDEDYTLSDIRDKFGDEVAALVYGASEPEELINADRDIIRYYNNRLGDGVWDIFNASKDSVAWYYISMLDAFGNGDEGISDVPAFKEFGKCVGEIFGEVKV